MDPLSAKCSIPVALGLDTHDCGFYLKNEMQSTTTDLLYQNKHGTFSHCAGELHNHIYRGKLPVESALKTSLLEYV